MTTPSIHPAVLYVGGWGRSGSTLLDRLLGQTPGTVSVGEMRDIWLRGVLEDRRCGCGHPFLDCPFWTEVGTSAFGGWAREHALHMHQLRRRYDRPWSTPALAWRRLTTSDLKVYTETTERLYGAIQQVSGARVIVDSTKIPSYAYLLRRIRSIDLRFVHLVRDSRGVVDSWRKTVQRPDATGEADQMIRYGTVSASGRYDLYNGLAGTIGWTRTPYLRVRYEDLATDPRVSLRRILRFAGLPEEVGFLDQDVATLQPSHTVDGNPMRFSEGPIAVRLDETWRDRLPGKTRTQVTALTAPFLLRYGYQLRAPYTQRPRR